MARDKTTKTKYPGVFRRVEDDRLVIRAKCVWPKTGKPVDREQVCDAGTTLTQAVALRLAMIAKVKSGVDEVNEIPTLRAWSEKWVTRKSSNGDWREGATSEMTITGVINNHILPRFGDYLLDKITVADLNSWLDNQIANGGRPTTKGEPTKGKASTVKVRWVVLASMIHDGCVEHGLPNPAESIKAPRIGRSGRKGGADMVLMPNDVARFVADVEQYQPKWLPLVLLGFATGARPSELVPARVGDLDLTDPSGIGKWTISRHFGYGSTILDGTKTTEEECRVVFIDANVTGRLRELLRGRFPGEFILPGRSPSGATDKSNVMHMARRVAERIGLPPTIAGKVFRQTHATLSRIQGVPDLALQAQLGHSSAQTTDIYSRMPEEARRQVALRMGSIIPNESEKVGEKVGVSQSDGNKT
jgi:integrase